MKWTPEFNSYDLLSAVQSNVVSGEMGIAVTYLDALQDADKISSNSGC